MAVTRAKDSSVNTGTKYISFLAGNPAFTLASFDSIATTVAAGGETSITLSAIPQTYVALQLRVLSKDSVNATGTDYVDLRFNADSGTNYAYHSLQGSGSAASASGSATQNTIRCYYGQTRGGATLANMFGASIIDIHDYASTTRNKTVRSFSGADTNGGGGIALNSGVWLNTAAVTSVTLLSGGSNTWAAGSRFELYGLVG